MGNLVRESGYGLVAVALGVSAAIATRVYLKKISPLEGMPAYIKEIGVKHWCPEVVGATTTLFFKGLIDWFRPKDNHLQQDVEKAEKVLKQAKKDKEKLAEWVQNNCPNLVATLAPLSVEEQVPKIIEAMLAQHRLLKYNEIPLYQELSSLKAEREVNEKLKEILKGDHGSFVQNVIAFLKLSRFQIELLSPGKEEENK
ncbi:MAG: hypothetical protein JSR80_03965 [Verrucomicrobia bacterium]|nr:hypothetical protein [Verrucomicrobiota bacterium]